MNELDKMMPKIEGAIEQMAKAMGVAAGHVYSVLVRQSYAEGISGIINDAIWVIMAIIAAVTCYKVFRWAVKNLQEGHKNNRYYDGEPYIAACVFCVLGFIASVVIGVLYASDFQPCILKIINPEYYAIQTIIAQVKK